ncbi:DEAD/DEAH box helicase family protein [Ekhidna sp.]|jgi:type III restriction enzyme|uniref:DEAD/DEAH box helicase n=1 Tax=Ekhidna sp. TaxID=2608089 RepID=UPI0032EF0491
MNQKANYIKQRLSLREPLKESLDIVVQLCDELELKKDIDLSQELEKVTKAFPTCVDFEREFPSLCFSIATGVGKTRLMGACITYLHLEKGINNFFILAPNLTIYDKLIKDFGEPGYEKYVFKGISEFVHNTPQIITGDNYAQSGQMFTDEAIRINIFNISKFNRDAGKPRGNEAGMLPRIKRLSEYLGESYWSYLSDLDDLVILMDEAHRYHADASRKAINELKPILGLELTATPIDEKGHSFKNVVYEYSLAKALEDGKYVKSPAIATRKDFNSQGLSASDIEKIKLEDAISVHNKTKNELEIYAKNNGVRLVKPFVLVVCKDIDHASEIQKYVSSKSFYNGEFEGKVLQIDSSTKKEEEIERQFVELETTANQIEIVIHVNMLKEGWDVNNLYTIVPLRAANAGVLIEQTIGRGLRLPYNGERTGVESVDKLTVLAHENFEKVIEEAQNPDSILNKMSQVVLEDDDLKQNVEVITSGSTLEVELKKEEDRIAAISNEKEKQIAQHSHDAKKSLIYVLPTFSSDEGVSKVSDLERPEIKKAALEKLKSLPAIQSNLFGKEVVDEAEKIYDSVVGDYKNKIIEIPRMELTLGEVQVGYEDFDLVTSSGFDFTLLSEEIMVMELTGEKRTENINVQFGSLVEQTPVNQVIGELMDFPEVDYDENADLLNKLVKQAIDYLDRKIGKKDDLALLVRQFRKLIAKNIYDQMQGHFMVEEPKYGTPNVQPFVKIEDWNFSVMKDGRRDFKDTISPVGLIPKLVFSGFAKACHFEYKFDSKTEKDFAFVLEQDKSVLKWMRPAPGQFRIYWANNSKQYLPDFVVETQDVIYLVETKAAGQMNTDEVKDKKRAALQYCKHASDFTAKNKGKKWSYLLIPHDEIKQTSSMEFLVKSFEQSK